MKEAILEKINLVLLNGIDNEPKTLYLLAEIRKYIDWYGKAEKHKYPNLYFYCNLVLHIQMDRTPAKIILNRFEYILSSGKSLKEMSNIFKEEARDFYSFIDLKMELIDFFKAYNLSTKLVENDYRWLNFTKLLVEILMDCPLINEDGMVSKFSYEKDENKQIQFSVNINKIKSLGSFEVILKDN